MRRRDFIFVLGGAVVTRPLSARAQQPNKMRRVGVLAPFNEKDPESQVNFTAFKKRLAELGWIEGRNIIIDYRFTGGSTEQIRAAAEELVAAAPDVIFAASNVSVAPLRKATSTIPIVFTQVGDPVGSGFVTSLAQPGGNITGFQGYEAEIGGKWLEFLKEIAPKVRRVAVVLNPNVSANVAFLHTAGTAATSWSVKVTAVGVRSTAEIEPAVNAFAREPDGGMIVTPSPLTNTTENRALLFALAAQLGLPAIYPYRLVAGSSGLISYSYAAVAQWQGGATYLDRILRGAKPADLPVQAPTKYDMIINLKTAKTLGLTVPPALLAQADEVIE
jgi:putative tryptophan/tyrosine transport system substrate-binding protein